MNPPFLDFTVLLGGLSWLELGSDKLNKQYVII
jgi:hypothetical protein